jgi:hypothetical protein
MFVLHFTFLCCKKLTKVLLISNNFTVFHADKGNL